MDNLGERIKELRKSRGMTQQILAEKLNLSRSQISNLEKNRRSLNLEQLDLLCDLFKVDMAFFGVSPTAEETISLLERARLLFESDISEDKKDELYRELMQIYLKSKE
jgi:transcriptional regulator with XRE-family HTH domain